LGTPLVEVMRMVEADRPVLSKIIPAVDQVKTFVRALGGKWWGCS
jgi:hypothetical protein